MTPTKPFRCPWCDHQVVLTANSNTIEERGDLLGPPGSIAEIIETTYSLSKLPEEAPEGPNPQTIMVGPYEVSTVRVNQGHVEGLQLDGTWVTIPVYSVP